jgi:putative exporter of polyketide antibiotics
MLTPAGPARPPPPDLVFADASVAVVVAVVAATARRAPEERGRAEGFRTAETGRLLRARHCYLEVGLSHFGTRHT